MPRYKKKREDYDDPVEGPRKLKYFFKIIIIGNHLYIL